MLRRSAAYGMFKKYLKGEMLSTYRSLGFVTKKSDPIDDISLRQSIVQWMCELDYEDCRRERCRPCPFIQILSRFYPDFIQIF